MESSSPQHHSLLLDHSSFSERSSINLTNAAGSSSASSFSSSNHHAYYPNNSNRKNHDHSSLSSISCHVHLNFDRVPFAGRASPMERPQNILNLTQQRNEPAVVFLEGPAGCGKSTLIQEFLSSSQANAYKDSHHLIQCCGKFDQAGSGMEPFAAFEEVLLDLLGSLNAMTHDQNETIRTKIRETIREDVLLLCEAFPNMDPLLSQLISPSQGHTHHNANNHSSTVDLTSTTNDSSTNSESSAKNALVKSTIGQPPTTVPPTAAATTTREMDRWTFERVRYALRSLLRVVSQQVPLVLFFDDAQWASEASMAMLSALVKDVEPRRCLLLCAHRPVGISQVVVVSDDKSGGGGGSTNSSSNNPDKKNPLQAALESLESESNKIVLHCLQLSNLTADAVADILTALLRRDRDEVETLLEIVVSKTACNPFFVLQFLSILEQQALLGYSTTTYRWEWDDRRVLEETDISDNILDVVASKIQTVSSGQQRGALMTAATLGLTRFDLDTLYHAISTSPPAPATSSAAFGAGHEASLSSECEAKEECPDIDDTEHSIESLHDALRSAVEDGYLEELAPRRFKFAHDRVREGALLLLPKDIEKRAELHLGIGRRLCRLHESIQNGSKENSSGVDGGSAAAAVRVFFQAVWQLNLGSANISDDHERLHVAELNYEAAQLAIQRTSFVPAADFLRAGIDLLGANSWEKNYDLTLKLKDTLARAEYCCGRQDSSIALADQVLAHAKTFTEKKQAHHTKILCLQNQHKVDEAIRETMSILHTFGVRFPCRFKSLHVIAAFLRTKQKLKKWTEEELLNLPESTDENAADMVEFLERLAEVVLTAADADVDLFALVVLKCLDATLKYGRIPMTGTGFVAWGFMLTIMGEYSEGERYARIGLSYAERGLGGVHDSRAVTFYLFEVYHWQHPFNEGIDLGSRAINHLWNTGAIETFLNDAIVYLRAYFCSGLRLEPLHEDIRRYVMLLREFRNMLALDNSIAFFQAVSNLRTADKGKEIAMTGEFMDEELVQRWTESKGEMYLQGMYPMQCMLGCIFNEFEFAHGVSKKMWAPLHEGPDSFAIIRYFFPSFAALCLYKSTRKAKYRRKGMVAVRVFEKWVRKGVVSCHPLLLLLKAEVLSSTKRASAVQVQAAFDKAISANARLGIMHQQAMANERAGVYFLGANDTSWASVYLLRARALYNDWGAPAKVRHMEDEYKLILADTSESLLEKEGSPSRRSSSLQARSRLNMSTKEHCVLNI